MRWPWQKSKAEVEVPRKILQEIQGNDGEVAKLKRSIENYEKRNGFRDAVEKALGSAR